ncbi:tripartite tricarboxylate transporter TctB family protein [Starkeya sp. ORNL1]|uniref:tripartite tricarboxylate transporter TctB family protein n=1 Tax=Starkeya sp. ORNL1 TaxID=2709380 RepID=UPI0014628878|nr:tripartite tricarboxylate transporter TctB family protein [Starkeya sp. ORNL1]QJP12779.1 tripartite tricarboxylate transporter TctB family protein [Starkeya sp. ORNL1]
MTHRQFDWPDLLFGGFLIVVAAGTFAATWKLAGGTAANMGPGYMPRAIALVLLGFGLFFTGRGIISSHAGIERVHVRPLLAISVAVGLFALLVESLGLAVASLATIVVAAFASHESRFFEIIVFGLCMTAAAILLFVKVLALPVPVWPW